MFPPEQLFHECSWRHGEQKPGPLERRDLDMQDGGDPAVDGGETAIDGRGEFIGLADEFSVRAERTADI